MNVDSINWKILALLQENARFTHTEIGKKVGITSPAVTERIRKMEDIGLIAAYRTELNPYELGYQLKAIITLRAFMGKLKPFLEKVTSLKEVIDCYRITGNENIVMIVVLRNHKHLESLIDRLISYGETKTQIILSTVVKSNPVTQPQ